jgi:hypothetical protein
MDERRGAAADDHDATEELDLATPFDVELVEQMHNDLYDGMADGMIPG